mmetsp:Transcript_24613/g.35477  ORF Transcript_24613/g.35477 Transcript_24613/m.35477 type:complete len:127 (-) Transcript_24613:129-509(-)
MCLYFRRVKYRRVSVLRSVFRVGSLPSADGEALEALVVVVHVLFEEVSKGMDVLFVVYICKPDSLWICVDVSPSVLGQVDGFSDDCDEGLAVREEPKPVVEYAPAVEDHWSDIDDLLQGLLKVSKF